MYEEAFHFATRPFSILPDPSCLSWTDSHKQAFQAIDLGIRRGCPLVLITGEVGCGKTTLIRHFLDSAPENYNIGLLSSVFRGSLLEWALLAFGQPFANETFVTLIDRFQSHLIEEFAAGRNPVLIVDEAQHLTDRDLETLRLLLNINSGSDLLLQIVLVGQPELRERLSANEFRQIVQRIGSDFHLRAMNAAETADYIRDRVVHAGGSANLFDGSALESIHAITRGVPRKINLLCELCLVIAFAEEADRIDAALVDSAMTDVRKNAIFRTLTDDENEPQLPPADVADGREKSGGSRAGGDAGPDGEDEAGSRRDTPAKLDPVTGTVAAERMPPSDAAGGRENEVPDQNATPIEVEPAASEQGIKAITGSEADPATRTDADPGDARTESADDGETGSADHAPNVVPLAPRVGADGGTSERPDDQPEADESAGDTALAAGSTPVRREVVRAKPGYRSFVAAVAASVAVVGGFWVFQAVTEKGGPVALESPDAGRVAVLDAPVRPEAALSGSVARERILPPVARGTEAAAEPETFGGELAVRRPDRIVPGLARRAPPVDRGRQDDGLGHQAPPKKVSLDDHGPAVPAPPGSTRVINAPIPLGLRRSVPTASETFDRAMVDAVSSAALRRVIAVAGEFNFGERRMPSISDTPFPSPSRSSDEAMPSVGLTGLVAAVSAIEGRTPDAPVRPFSNHLPVGAGRSRVVRLAALAEFPPESGKGLATPLPANSRYPDRELPRSRLNDSFLVLSARLTRVPHPAAPGRGNALTTAGAISSTDGAGFKAPATGDGRDTGAGVPSTIPMRLAMATPAPGRTTDLPGAATSDLVFEMFVLEGRLQGRSGNRQQDAHDQAGADPASARATTSGTRHFLKALEMGLEDPTAAVVHYARAAIAGHRRSAYYLGQIYESGDGVPVDLSLARAWYKAAGSDNRRARRRLRELPEAQRGPTLRPPVLLSSDPAGRDSVDFVWTSDDGTDPAFYLLQIVERPSDGAGVAAVLTASATRLTIPINARYWRVVAVDPAASRYATSAWKALPGLEVQAPTGSPRPSAAGLAPSVIISAARTTAGKTVADLEGALERLAIRARVVATEKPLGVVGAVYYFYEQDLASARAISRLLSIPVTRVDPAPSADFETQMPLPGLIVVSPGTS